MSFTRYKVGKRAIQIELSYENIVFSRDVFLYYTWLQRDTQTQVISLESKKIQFHMKKGAGKTMINENTFFAFNKWSNDLESDGVGHVEITVCLVNSLKQISAHVLYHLGRVDVRTAVKGLKRRAKTKSEHIRSGAGMASGSDSTSMDIDSSSSSSDSDSDY